MCDSLTAALNLIQISPELSTRIENIFIIGGSSLYIEAMKSANLNKIYLTQVLKQFESDTSIPNINLDTFDLVEQSDVQTENNIPFQFLVYKRKLN